jgi:hypothetical protein
MLDIKSIRIDGGTQSRVELNQETVAEYAEAYKAGASFPPVIVFFDGTDRWLADGFHRYFGATAAGLTQIYEEVIPGTQRDAIKFSLGANEKHGIRRTNADKRKAVLTALSDSEWSQFPHKEIAAMCSVSREYVSRLASEIESSCDRSQDTVRKVTRNGTTYEQETANIGASGNARPRGKEKKVPASKWLKAEFKAASLQNEVAALRGQLAGASPAASSDGEDIEDHGADFDPLAELELANAENTKLRKLMETDDKAAEALRWQDAYETIKRRSDEHLTTIQARDRRIDFLSRQLDRCGKAVGEKDLDKIAPTVEDMARAARAAV